MAIPNMCDERKIYLLPVWQIVEELQYHHCFIESGHIIETPTNGKSIKSSEIFIKMIHYVLFTIIY